MLGRRVDLLEDGEQLGGRLDHPIPFAGPPPRLLRHVEQPGAVRRIVEALARSRQNVRGLGVAMGDGAARGPGPGGLDDTIGLL
jgi:hypothetical protein